jgi:hypothetical protein
MELMHDSIAKRRREDSVPSELKLTIHNLCPNIRLAHPVYVSNHVTCYRAPDQIVDIGSTAKIGFKNNLFSESSSGVLLYKLKITYEESNEATWTQIFMFWSVHESGELFLTLYLIEHDKSDVLDKNRLMRLIEDWKGFNIRCNLIEETWLMHDNIMLMLKINVIREAKYYKLEMTISETSVRDDTWRLHYYDMDR